MRESVGFFVPPLVANFTFYLTGSATSWIELSTDASEELWSQIADLASGVPDLTHELTSASLFCVHARDKFGGDFSGFDQQISEPLALIAGEYVVGATSPHTRSSPDPG